MRINTLRYTTNEIIGNCRILIPNKINSPCTLQFILNWIGKTACSEDVSLINLNQQSNGYQIEVLNRNTSEITILGQIITKTQISENDFISEIGCKISINKCGE